MKRYYCFLPACAKINPTQKIYKVWFGNCDHELRSFIKLQQYAGENHCFFQLWNEQTEFIIKSMITPRDSDCPVPCFGLQVVYTDICSLWAAIKNNELGTIENPKEVVANYRKLMESVSSKQYVQARINREKNSVPTLIRKNLSAHGCALLCKEVCPFASMCLEFYQTSVCGALDALDSYKVLSRTATREPDFFSTI